MTAEASAVEKACAGRSAMLLLCRAGGVRKALCHGAAQANRLLAVRGSGIKHTTFGAVIKTSRSEDAEA